MSGIEAEEAQRTVGFLALQPSPLLQGLQPSARLHDFPNEILEAIFVAAATNTGTKSSGGALMVWSFILDVFARSTQSNTSEYLPGFKFG
jgi:hypothetical protein